MRRVRTASARGAHGHVPRARPVDMRRASCAGPGAPTVNDCRPRLCADRCLAQYRYKVSLQYSAYAVLCTYIMESHNGDMDPVAVLHLRPSTGSECAKIIMYHCMVYYSSYLPARTNNAWSRVSRQLARCHCLFGSSDTSVSVAIYIYMASGRHHTHAKPDAKQSVDAKLAAMCGSS